MTKEKISTNDIRSGERLTRYIRSSI